MNKGSSFKYLLKEGFKNIWSNRMMSIASAAVLICCLVLCGVAILFSLNVNVALKSIENTNSIQVYLKDDLNTIQSLQVGKEIEALENVAEAEFVPKDEAIQRYVDAMGNSGDVFDSLYGKDNPLPNAYRVTFDDLSIYRDTAEQIKQIDGVQKINDYFNVARILTLMDRIALYGGIAIVAFFALVSLLIISNTIRATMHSRQLEISIMKSVGATSTFIRIPFLVEGMLLGLFSGAIACGLIIPAYIAIVNTFNEIMPRLSFIQPSSVIWWIIAGALVVGVLFGLGSGLFSIRRYLKREGGNSLG